MADLTKECGNSHGAFMDKNLAECHYLSAHFLNNVMRVNALLS